MWGFWITALQCVVAHWSQMTTTHEALKAVQTEIVKGMGGKTVMTKEKMGRNRKRAATKYTTI